MESTILIASHLGFLLVGALLTGWAAWMFRADAAGGATAREQAARRLALLEEVALQLANTQHLLETGRSPADHEAALEQRQRIIAALQDMPLAEARLRLLDEMGICKALQAYTRRIDAFRRRYPAGSTAAGNEQAGKAMEEIRALHDKLHESLARRYRQRAI